MSSTIGFGLLGSTRSMSSEPTASPPRAKTCWVTSTRPVHDQLLGRKGYASDHWTTTCQGLWIIFLPQGQRRELSPTEKYDPSVPQQPRKRKAVGSTPVAPPSSDTASTWLGTSCVQTAENGTPLPELSRAFA
eukprot:4674762-Amphidinium_carterae.1